MKTGNTSLAPLSPTFLKTLLNSNWDFPSIPSPLSRHHHTKLRFPQAEIWGKTQIFKYNFLATLKILLIEINMAEGRRRIRRTLLRRQRAPSPPPPQKKKKVNDRLNPLEIYTDDYLHFENFRFRRPTIHYLLGLLIDRIVHTNIKQALPPVLQLLVFLRFFCYWNISTWYKFFKTHNHNAQNTINLTPLCFKRNI